jgi:hypothetical protein
MHGASSGRLVNGQDGTEGYLACIGHVGVAAVSTTGSSPRALRVPLPMRSLLRVRSSTRAPVQTD